MKIVNKFTDAMVRNLKATGKRYDITEGNGFILRVTPTGKKSWAYSYWFNNKSKRFTVGHYPALSVAQARKAVSDAGLLKDNGIDPAQQKKDKEEAARQEQARELQTIEWLINEFYENSILKNRKAPQQVEQQKNADIIPLLGKYKIDEITTPQITAELRKIVKRGSPVHANKVLSTVKQMFNYALSEGIIDRNPAQVINSKNIGGVEPARSRVLSYEEIKIIWHYFSDNTKHSIHPATVAGLKILLLTGVRTGSLIQAHWKEIDFDNSLWTIPANHLKLKKTEEQKEHKVHLAPITIEILLELKELAENNPFILPGRTEGQPLNDKGFSRIIRRSRGRIEGIEEDFNAHDFRAALSTHLAEMGVPPHISEKCLGHKLPKILETYNKHEYLSERKEALEQWASKIEMLVTNSNVVLLQA